MTNDRRTRRSFRTALVGVLSVLVALAVSVGFTASAAARSTRTLAPRASGGLDCNGYSPIQTTTRSALACTDVRGFAQIHNKNTWNGRFYDNGHYIGHDEPDLTFLSSRPGSGNDVTWSETLPQDPSAAPTVSNPGSDVTHWAELSVAPWFSMALCNAKSYPLLPCTPNSDSNAPTNSFAGGGSSFLEMQFYPPGMAPFFDNISCDNKHWCSSLHINDLECTAGFASCNPNCEEPTNFAWVQTNGVPTGPASPQEATLASYSPDIHTLLMNPGDRLQIHIWDAPIPAAQGGGFALEVSIKDLNTKQTGFMQASAANGFAATSISDCSGTPFNYEPEYSTASKNNIVPWAALQTDISTEFEIGHFTPCSSLDDPATDGLLSYTAGDPFWLTCNGPYESEPDGGLGNSEGFGGDAFCYPVGDTHTALNGFGIFSDPNIVTGCLDDLSGGDLDYDGTSYWADWPTGTTPTATTPASFVQFAPTTSLHSYPYEQSFFQTDAALSESGCTGSNLSGCTIPPPGPGNFYPYWSETKSHAICTIQFGNVASGQGVNDFGGDAQYGPNLFPELGYPEFESAPMPNTC
jgi:hypothetical protein